MTMIIKLRQRNMHQYLFIHYHLQRIRPQRRWRRDRNQHQKWVVRDVCCGTNELRSIITPSHHQCLNKALFLFYSCSTWSCRFLWQDEGASSVYSNEHVRTKCVCTLKMFWRGRAAKCLRGEHLLNWFSSPGFFRYLQVGTSHCVRTFVSDISSTQYSQSVRLMNIRMSWQDRCKEGRNTTHNVSFDDYVSQERDWRATLPLPLTSMLRSTANTPKNSWSKADECKTSI